MRNFRSRQILEQVNEEDCLSIIASQLCRSVCLQRPQKTAPISDRSSITTSNPYQPIDRNTIRYTVKRGDTLSQIARRSGHSVHDLAGWNNLANVNALEVGQVLRVQPPEGAAATTAVASSSAVQVRSIDEAKKESGKKTVTQPALLLLPLLQTGVQKKCPALSGAGRRKEM